MKTKRASKGYILIELILVIGISIMIMSLIIIVLKSAKNINNYYNDKIEIEENAKNIEDVIKLKLRNIKILPKYEVGNGSADSENFKPAKGIFYNKMKIVNGKIICYNEKKEDKELKIENNKMYVVDINGGNNYKYQIGCYIKEMRILKYNDKDYFYVKLIMEKDRVKYIRKFKIHCR